MRKFKVGDRVRVVGHSEKDFEEYYVGRVGEVYLLEVNESYHVKLDDNNGSDLFYEEELDFDKQIIRKRKIDKLLEDEL